jgi:hypothetical protein
LQPAAVFSSLLAICTMDEDAGDTPALLLEATGEASERNEAQRREGEQAHHHHHPPAESSSLPTASADSGLPQISLSADTMQQAERETTERPKAAGPLPPLRGEGAHCDTCSTTDEPRYRCPGCHTRSCSLKCVKAHKERTGCDGQAPRSRFAPHASELPENVLWHGEAVGSRGSMCVCVCVAMRKEGEGRDSREETRQNWACFADTRVAGRGTPVEQGGRPEGAPEHDMKKSRTFNLADCFCSHQTTACWRTPPGLWAQRKGRTYQGSPPQRDRQRRTSLSARRIRCGLGGVAAIKDSMPLRLVMQMMAYNFCRKLRCYALRSSTGYSLSSSRRACHAMRRIRAR